MKEEYKKIINNNHHVSSVRAHMSLYNRSAQFAPFAALVGYDSSVKEESRLTDKRAELDEQELEILNYKMQKVKENIDEHLKVKITYFISDIYKTGGEYSTVSGYVKKIDSFNSVLIFEDGFEIPMNDIFDIDADFLNNSY